MFNPSACKRCQGCVCSQPLLSPPPLLQTDQHRLSLPGGGAGAEAAARRGAGSPRSGAGVGPPRSAGGAARVPAERSAKVKAAGTQSDRHVNVLFIATVDDLMHLACSSVFYGGGTNQELAHHCLYQCEGDILVSTALRTAAFRPRRPALVRRCQGNRIWGGVKAPTLPQQQAVFQNAQTASSAENTRVCSISCS